MPTLDEDILRDLQQMLYDHNPYVTQFKQAAERMQQEQECDVQMIIHAENTPDPRRYNAP